MKKNWGKSIMVMLCAIIITASIIAAPDTHSASAFTAPETIRCSVIEYSDAVSPHMEETTWVFRNNNGKLQMRLWSYTEGKWLTDWIDCN